jgi:hypothetical protein
MTDLKSDDVTPAESAPLPDEPELVGERPTLQRSGAVRENPVRAALQVIPVLVFVGTCLALVKYATRPITNTDTYFHLRFGDEFLSGAWSLRDPGSVTPFATNEWLPTQWLPQVVMAWTEDKLGMAGISWLAGVWYLAFAVALYVAARRQAPALVAAAITVLGLAAAQPALSPRPQVLSYVFVLVFTVAWLGSIKDGRARWWLVPLTWLWAMVHGMWPLAIMLGLVGAAGALLERRHTLQVRLRLFLVPVLCALAGAVTPLGPALYGAVAQVGANAHYFTEWASTDFRHPMGYLTGLMIAITLLLRVRRAEAMPWGELAFLALAAGAAAYSFRTLPVAVAVVTPLLAASIAPHVLPQATRRWEKLTVAGTVAGCLVMLAALAPNDSGTGQAAPSWMADELGAMPAHTVVLDSTEWGGYLMWAYPQLDLVSHGYGDTFTAAELERNQAIFTLSPGWDELVTETGADYALIRPESALAYALETQLGWEVVQRQDDDVALLRAP